MSESGDYNPGPWSGHSFKSARQTYDRHVGRSYSQAVSSDRDKSSFLEKKVITQSTSPLVIACDVTGSMGDWPATMFSKLPYLELEGKEYLGEDMEICFAAVGDAYTDKYPLQVRPFTSGTDLKKRLQQLIIEGNGGGQMKESYELPALYFANNCEMPNAINPVFIYIGDEGLYDFVNKAHAKDWAYTKVDGRKNSKTVIEELMSKFSVYLIRKPYQNGWSDNIGAKDRQIYQQWSNILGEERISILPEAGRVVDTIFGILAQETNRIDYFHEELVGRQTPQQVETVMKSLYTIHKGQGDSIRHSEEGESIMRRMKKAKGAKSLI
ncbi:hypothetical protein HOK51_05550 [Candidatus Woesearchaeota archaeon]|jgi:hypothetical protein|nr:hypothetical protein [Candidatus Woesearchaeota archaeon]MBT6519293.1 hypothetical protein [Candidatus Woesearchaeota archaeon]MBT7368946.1 hypothetical protein [Candidatus Woesearchaeota archaeon]